MESWVVGMLRIGVNLCNQKYVIFAIKQNFIAFLFNSRHERNEKDVSREHFLLWRVKDFPPFAQLISSEWDLLKNNKLFIQIRIFPLLLWLISDIHGLLWHKDGGWKKNENKKWMKKKKLRKQKSLQAALHNKTARRWKEKSQQN